MPKPIPRSYVIPGEPNGGYRVLTPLPFLHGGDKLEAAYYSAAGERLEVRIVTLASLELECSIGEELIALAALDRKVA